MLAMSWLELFLLTVAYPDFKIEEIFYMGTLFTLTACGEIRIALVSFRTVAHVTWAIDCIHTIAV
jgi:hypothetical protein